MITLQTVKPAHVRLPRVYRYLDNEYIGLFFEKGILRLSSFLKVREHLGEIRGDEHEGRGAILSESKEGFHFAGSTDVGNDSYMLCTSVIESEELMKEFGYDGYFRILDPLAFSLAVANSIPGFTQAIQGLCYYQEHRLIDKAIPGMSVNDFVNAEGELIIGGPKMIERLGQMVGDGSDLMFLKEKKYQRQAEYRFVWRISTQFFELQKSIDIECREAIQFCERVVGR